MNPCFKKGRLLLLLLFFTNDAKINKSMHSKLFRFLIFSLFILLTSGLYSQQNQTDQLGRKQGKWVKYKDGVKFYEGEFKDDKPVGEFLRYYQSGRLSSKSVFSKEGSHCMTEIYYDKRKNPLKAKGIYIDQQKDSIWVYYNNEGILVNEESYRNGVPHGIWKLYNYFGALVKETPYVDGKIEGMQKEFFETGELKRSMQFVKDSLQGDFRVYFPDESLRIKGQFNQGMQDLEWYYYNEDGSVEFIEYYEMGSLIKRTDEEGHHYELQQEIDTVNIRQTPEELMELK